MKQLSEYTPRLEVPLCGRNWVLDRAADLETLWESMVDDEFGDDERLPYWTELWPSSLVLGEHLFVHKEEIVGKRCLDIGCGLGLTAIIASWLGAHVIAMDYEFEALRFARKNAALNDVPQPVWTLMDWRFPAVRPQSVDVMWGGDIMYEVRFVEPVLSFLEHCLVPGGRAWVAEPNRNVYKEFKAQLDKRGWKSRKLLTEKTSAIYEQPSKVTVNLWELSR
ncbi:class I SAM-dependent methyltransferase [Halodesulfovibrio spirochaetisodalis]|uniref:Methyltransferase n=1 Tax=Halodesulfovibrio spirochaetisodalis TaxID=1560234 RepID=A0A1B7X994_9BACT|nr:50S ribosomal protein L11 methyltransferase [Halodesulfovibrio spirochaetisodalis]OBQ45917.1 methyltransferase [Halodesulfovibrio spirochaetisodalis]